MTRIITVTSGKGGVGKTNLSANLAVQLSMQGRRACIFDADLGLANINILFGLYPEKTIEDVITGATTLSHIAIKNQHGIDIIPGSSGVESIANCEAPQIERLIASFAALPTYDFLFFDTAAGVSRMVVSFCLAAGEIILVVTPEPTSLTDSYALLKILCANGLKSPVRVVINHCKDTTAARQTYARFRDVTKKYLPVDLQPLGFIVEDPKISFAVKRQQPFIHLYPDALASKCIKAIANNLVQLPQDAFAAAPTVASFWKQFVTRFTGRLALMGDHEPKQKAATVEEVPPDVRLEPQTSVEPTVPPPLPDVDPAAPSVPAPSPEPAAASAQHSESPAPQGTDKTFHEDTHISELPVGKQARDEEPPQPSSPAESSLPLPEGRDFYQLLHVLVGSISGIAEEFRLLRKAIEGNGSFPAAGAAPKGQPAPITLDFEAFMKKHRRDHEDGAGTTD